MQGSTNSDVGSPPGSLEQSLDSITDLFITMDQGDLVTFANEPARRWLGQHKSVFEHSLLENRPELRESYDLAKRLGASGDAEIEVGGMHFEWRFFPLDEGMVILIRDISVKKRQEAELLKQVKRSQKIVAEIGHDNANLIVTSERDSLTGLNNRHRYTEFSRESFGLSRSRKHAWAITVLDIDFFKSINDEFGHDVGDTVLKAVAEALKRVAGPQEFLARYGGEEFVILTTGLSAAMVMERATEFREQIEQIKGLPRDVTASFGVALALPADVDSDQVFQRADSAMYAAKKDGRNRVKLHPKDAHSNKLAHWSYSIRKFA